MAVARRALVSRSAAGSGRAISVMPNLAGYSVHATDGDIGSIDEASYDVGSARLVVDTGP